MIKKLISKHTFTARRNVIILHMLRWIAVKMLRSTTWIKPTPYTKSQGLTMSKHVVGALNALIDLSGGKS